jgi:zinc transport system substrate-binding protein
VASEQRPLRPWIELRLGCHEPRIAVVRTKIILIPLALLSLAGCGGSASHGKRLVVASFYPLAFAALELGDGRVEVRNLTPAGAEPHDLELTPKALEEVRSAGLVLLLGHGFQPQLERAAGNGKKVLRLLDTPGLRRFSNGDPHVWLDPLRYALIVKRIGAALHARPTTQRLTSRLQALDAAYRRGLARCARRDIVTSHEAFAYLAQRYGLRQIAITGLSPEAEPAPRDLQRVVELVRGSGATTVFFETLVSPRIADTVARETGAKTAVLDPIEGLTPAEQGHGTDYFSLMRSNLAHLRAALGCR